MSSVFKGVKKVFKKVASGVGKMLPAVLAVGAIVFTAGAALGLPAMAGGWGGAVSSVFGSGSTVSNVLSGAVTQAGYGAAIGGVGSALTGGDFSSGAMAGAVTGGVAGGAMGGLGMGTDPLGNMLGTAQTPTGTVPAGATAPTGATNAGALPPPPTAGTPSPAAAPLNPATAGAPVTGPTPVPATPSQASSGFGAFLSKNQTLVGNALGGLGSGLLQGMGAKEAAEAEERRARQIRDSYNVSDDALVREWKGDPTARPEPKDAYAYDDKRGRRYVYNPKTRRVEKTAQA